MLKCTAPRQQSLRSALPPIGAASSCLLVSPSLPTAGLVLDAASLSPVCGQAERVSVRTAVRRLRRAISIRAQVLDCLRQSQHARRVRAIKAGRVCARVQRDCRSEVSGGAVGLRRSAVRSIELTLLTRAHPRTSLGRCAEPSGAPAPLCKTRPSEVYTLATGASRPEAQRAFHIRRSLGTAL